MIKKKGILQSMIIKEPLKIDYEKDSLNDIIEQIQYSIEQHPSYLKVIPKGILRNIPHCISKGTPEEVPEAFAHSLLNTTLDDFSRDS